ncbi:pyridoxine/pyridoxamine 5'-phosphate oxidase [Metabacillus sp. Hm71]|uniref:pyridoxine/pyridoxamine 5'-phosphate oxidase n=1 Tax=Metabacillus sp. Hm71 TaxID=3450743 RepID=UPI003F440466
MEDIRNRIRESKTLVGPFPTFHVDLAGQYPYELFLNWFQTAIDYGVHEPHAMTLSTTDEYGYPDARVLILKDVDSEGWYFASSAQSKKGKQIEANPKVSLTFYWSLIGRQIRIRGTVKKMGEEQSARDFLNRGQIPRAMALIEKQSTVLSDPRDVEEALHKQLHRIQHNPTLVSPSWTLYKVVADQVEFWQADEERKHIRLQYQLEHGKWLKHLLWA